jgi:hypothetical protein
MSDTRREPSPHCSKPTPTLAKIEPGSIHSSAAGKELNQNQLNEATDRAQQKNKAASIGGSPPATAQQPLWVVCFWAAGSAA